MKKKPPPCETTAYAESVVAGKVVVCKYVRQACERHLSDLKRTDGKVWFDRAAAERFFKFCTYLRHYKGDFAGLPIELLPWQKFVFGCIYGWKRIEDGARTDNWRFNFVHIEVPRKHGKSTIAAAIAAYDCAMVEPSGAEVFIAATKEDQAKIVWRDVAAYIKGSADAAATLEVLEGKSTIYAKAAGRTSFIKAVGHNSERLDGLNPLSIICDELHAWQGRQLWDVLAGSFGARSNFHQVAITTAGSNATGVCMEERNHLIGVLEGLYEADNKFGVIYTLDTGDVENWRDEALWFKANPSLGCGKSLRYMRDQAEKAAQQPSALNEFLMKQLNIWTDASDAWLSMDDWRACAGSASHADLAGKRCFAGMDLARVGDLSAVAYLFPKQTGVPVPRLVVDFYIPEDGMQAREDRDKVPYRTWVREGHMTALPGKTTDYSGISAAILARAKAWDIESVAYDRHFAGELVQTLTKEGVNMVQHGMGFFSMAAPTADFERHVVARGLSHDGNPCLAWNAANVVVTRDPAGNLKPDKDKSTNRIDGIVAAIMALSGAMGYGKPKEEDGARAAGLRAMGTRGIRSL